MSSNDSRKGTAVGERDRSNTTYVVPPEGRYNRRISFQEWMKERKKLKKKPGALTILGRGENGGSY